ncbi:MerR family transcriptional regulator [Fusibacter ferrireducens]|uniref:MerR family transcriptional regulator n=1 Tax=Fusibacter ferrireducens TaxID=2785058 RepID=A0ABR9ZRN8_9FIRM|nr:MerR family transcriptional regulator [Fusibacter ferrireducens]MBF4693119.1 MerR family transcriptional regulator [Fusibacter ferrireducens]
MSKYTTGEMAKLCDVSVRTVQFYDTKELLKPAELSEGGRRLYSDDDLQKLHLICLLKTFGLSLDAIKDVLNSETPNKVLLLLLEEQARQIHAEIEKGQNQIKAIEVVMTNLRNSKTIQVNSINDIDHIMNGERKLKKTYRTMLAVGIPMDIIEIATIYIWITKGIWWPFAISMVIIIAIAILLLKMYYKNTAYICPECGVKFKPKFREFVFSKHTPKMRKLTCTACEHKGWCVETYSDEVQK